MIRQHFIKVSCERCNYVDNFIIAVAAFNNCIIRVLTNHYKDFILELAPKSDIDYTMEYLETEFGWVVNEVDWNFVEPYHVVSRMFGGKTLRSYQEQYSYLGWNVKGIEKEVFENVF